MGETGPRPGVADENVEPAERLARRLGKVGEGQQRLASMLRRGSAGSNTAADHLAAALETFERLGAGPWARRAAGELRVTGLAKSRAREQDHVSLTPQEREIATLAAVGLSNKQIGQRLFLSPRTVGGHPHRIFPKLGITSRAALYGALPFLPQAEDNERDS